ncbi:unnamed protein product [Brassica napus]|uniref:(rape) hypothetical protein n=1 Tax=Brassica napus TaxID=3708 RepID=A0A816IC30_BRANA|nr:unnamed protein product [Brassica napus]
MQRKCKHINEKHKFIHTYSLDVWCNQWLNNCDWEKELHHFHTSNGFGLAHANDKMWNSHAIFFRCFVAKKGTETELKRKLHVVFPRWPLPTIYVCSSHLLISHEL